MLMASLREARPYVHALSVALAWFGSVSLALDQPAAGIAPL